MRNSLLVIADGHVHQGVRPPSFYTEDMRATLTAILTALMLGVSGMSAGAVASSHVHVAETPSGTETAEDAATIEAVEPPVLVSVVAAEPLIDQTDEEFRFLVRMAATHEETLEAGQLRVSLGTEALSDTAALTSDAHLAEADTLASLTFIETPTLEPGSSFEAEFTISSEDFPLTVANAPGVYRTIADWSATSPTPVAPTIYSFAGAPFVWNPTAITSSLDLATIVPLVLPATDTPPTTPDGVNSALQSVRALQRIIPAAQTAESLIAADPRLVAYVRSLGASASSDARALVDLITGGELATFALEYGDADPLMRHLVSPDAPLDPTGLSFLTRYFTSPTEQVESDFASTRETAETGSLTDGSVPPEIAELVSWEAELEGFAWPAAGTVNAATLKTLTTAGYSQIVVGAGGASGAAKGMHSGATIYHSDEQLETAAQDLLLAATEFDEAEALAQLASLTALQSASATESVPAQSLIALDRDLVTASESLVPLVTELEALPWVRFIAHSELQLGEVELTSDFPIEPAVTSLIRAVEAEPEVTDFARVLAEPQLLIDYQRDRLIDTLSVRGSTVETEADLIALDERVAVHLAGNATLLGGVRIVETEHTRLIGTTSNIPLQFRNTLPFDARVTGIVSTGTAALLVQNPRIDDTIIPAASTLSEIVTVNSRVSSGEVELSVTLRDTHVGEAVDQTAFRVTLSGTTETIALSVLGVIIVALFAGGIWRSISRKRQATREG